MIGKISPKELLMTSYLILKIKSNKIFPLCVDIETAAVCDPICPHCYRQFVTTPDKIISESLCYKMTLIKLLK